MRIADIFIIAALLAQTGLGVCACWYLRRIRKLQFEIGEILFMGVLIRPSSEDAK